MAIVPLGLVGKTHLVKDQPRSPYPLAFGCLVGVALMVVVFFLGGGQFVAFGVCAGPPGVSFRWCALGAFGVPLSCQRTISLLARNTPTEICV